MSALEKHLSWRIKRLTGTLFDILHGVDTSGVVGEEALEISSVNRDKGVAYDPARWKSLARILRIASIPVEGFTFVDIGCGKGKVLLSAIQYPFVRIEGVEYSAYLCNVARRNLTHARLLQHRCTKVQVICADALEYLIPEGPTIFFFFNPFSYEIMEKFLRNVVSSYIGARRPIYLIFHGCSSYMTRAINFLKIATGDNARQRTSGLLGKRSLYVFELPDLLIR